LASSAKGKSSPCHWRRRAGEWALIVGLTALAAALRVFALGETPPGLYHDEAYNGLDALQVLAGQWPIYFAANNGREPLFIYLVAATVGLLGRTPGALRLAAALCGTLTIPITYLMVRAWFNRRTATLSATVLAITLWHVHLSRIGFRAITLPLTTALALWLGGRAYRSRRWYDWLLAGLMYGLCFYAYLPARTTPVALAAFAFYLLSTGRGHRLWPGALWFAVGAALALIPLGTYTLGHWDLVLGRLGQVSIFNPLVNTGDLWGTVGRQTAGTLGMFFVRGDTIPRHNLPGRPVFDLLLGTAMVWGLARSIRRARRKTSLAFTLIWISTMLTPTLLAGGAPHFLRAVGVLPMLVVLPALGLDAAMAWLERRSCERWTVALTCVVLAASLATTVWDYFARYRSSPQTAYAFEHAATELAVEANRFTGVGWHGSGMVAQAGDPEAGRRVYVDSRLWDEWTAIPFLTPEHEGLICLPTEKAPSAADATLLLLWPYKGVERYQNLLPRNARIAAHGGPLTQGDLEDHPYEAYVAFMAEPKPDTPTGHLARFGDQIVLIDYAVEASDREWQVQLEWMALAAPASDYTVFVHLRDGARFVAQDDGEPATGHYPTSLWRSGDVVLDTHVLEPPAEWKHAPWLAVGLYLWPTLERLDVVTSAGEPLGDELVLPIALPGP
jgi:4-amino-4-deoxy-L-arabinose transferase-like glycosyltransferase